MTASMLLVRILAKWRIIAAGIGVFKVLLMVLIPPIPPPAGDIFNWAGLAAFDLGSLSSGHFPSVSATGIYGFMGLVLVPFYWFWTQLPIEHLPIKDIGYLYYTSTPAVLLSLLLNVPTFLADIATGILVSKLVRQLTKSSSKSRLAFLAWFGNPFNIFWINLYGGMDVIPASVFVLAVLLGGERKWFRCGLCASVAAVLRVFPLFSFPFFLMAVRTEKIRGHVRLFSGFLVPLVLGLVILYATGAGTLAAIAAIPLRQYWLMDFLGWSLTNQYVRLTLVLVALQFLISIRFWRRPILLHLVTASLLALFVGSYAYGSVGHHFLWVSPLLTVCVALNPGESWIFIFTFLTASLYPPIFGAPAIPPLLGTFVGGAFYAAKTTYLLELNLRNIVPREIIESLKVWSSRLTMRTIQE